MRTATKLRAAIAKQPNVEQSRADRNGARNGAVFYDGNMLHARGTFTVNVKPLTPAPAEGLGRFIIDKEISGELEATSKGEMISAGDPRQGMAGYVAIEVVTGTLEGKTGSFALQHLATMDQNGNKMTVLITPGSGTGELQGISGTFEIQIVNRVHTYTLSYVLPATTS
jgi:hypothetical protein